MVNTEFAHLELKVDPADVDEDQFVSLWNLAAFSMNGDSVQARTLASKLLGFLCKHRCGLLTISPTDAKYLDEWFERDNTLLYDWKAESDKVDVLAQHAHVPFDLLCKFLRDHNVRSSDEGRTRFVRTRLTHTMVGEKKDG